MAAKKQAKPAGKRTSRGSQKTRSEQKIAKSARTPAPEARTRVIPLAALRAVLGTEIDRVRSYGGHTLILRRGRPVAAVIPYGEYESLIMDSNSNRNKKAPRMTPAEIMAEVDRVREAIAKADADRAARGLPVNTKSAAELIREIRDERTEQILNAARGKA